MEGKIVPRQLDDLPQLPTDSSIETEEKIVSLSVDKETIDIHVVQTLNKTVDGSKGLTVLFLHGASFTSKNWLDIKTLEHVANWGHKAIAMDLPGMGRSRNDIPDAYCKDFLTDFITKEDLTRVVLVSPSMSGMYSLPHLFKEPKKKLERIVGFVPIAPVLTGEYRSQYPQSQVPTLILYGTKDRRLPNFRENLELLPRHELAPIEGAGHACYLDDPDTFHKELRHFLKQLVA